MRIRLHESLKFRMPLVVLAGVVPLMLVAILYATNRATKTINKEAQENLIQKTQLLAGHVNRWNASNIAALRNLSQQPGVVDMNDIAKLESILATLVKSYDNFDLAHISDISGKSIASSDKQDPKFYGDRDYFNNVLAGNDINYQVLIARSSKKPALCIAAPISQQEIYLVGVATTCINLGTLTTKVGQLQFGETGYVFIVDNSGNVLAHPDITFISGDRLTNLRHFAPVKHALQVRSKSKFSFEDSGKDWLSWSDRLDNGWSVIVVQQTADFLSSQEEFENLALFIAIVAVFGVSVLVFILANRLITPIAQLTDSAMSVADGKLDRQVKMNRKDELGILAKSFNRMTSQLKNAFDNLEQRNSQLENAKEVAEKAQATAESANKAKDRFLANISHELRTPLNGILGYTKLVLSDEGLNSTHSQYLTVVEQSGNHLLNLINDILDISQTQLNQIELYPNELDLSSFLDETLDLVIILAKEKNLELKREWNELPAWVWVDEKRLRQVLINLLSNAIKFTKVGQVSLRVSAIALDARSNSFAQQKLRFEVVDTGVGMTQTQLSKIFQPFEQVGEIESRAEGTGLGLSISEGLVKLMGGQLKVKSQFRIGSTFWFDIVLPVLQKANKPKQQIVHNKIIIEEGTKAKILIVDDKQVNRELLVAILKPKGFEIFTANNGAQMLKMAAEIQPDLILLDLFMPVKTGFTSAKELRQDPKLKDIPLIIITASTITKEVSSYLDCEAVLQKPIDEKKLFALLRKYLSKAERTA